VLPPGARQRLRQFDQSAQSAFPPGKLAGFDWRGVAGIKAVYDEAKKCLQASIEMGDTNSWSSRIGLAELLLEHENEPLKALEFGR